MKAYAEGGDVLDAAERNKLPSHAFALPGRRYPIHNEAHARNALARVAQHGSPEEKAQVRAKVKAKYPGIEQSKAEGGEIEDEDHMQALEAHSQAMHEAMQSGDHRGHARAMEAFLNQHDLHKEQLPPDVKGKDVDNGPVSDEKDSKHVAIAGDSYE